VDTQLLVESRIDDGHRLLVEFVRGSLDVTAAAWIKSSDEGLWHLYVGSTSVSAGKLADAYRKVYSCMARVPKQIIELSEVKLLPAENPLVQELIAVRDRRPGWRIPPRFGGKKLGGDAFDQAYVYPRITPGLTRDEVIGTVTGLLIRTGAITPSTVTLRNGTVFRGIPFGLEINRQSGQQPILETKFMNDLDGSTQIVPVDDVSNIQ